MYVSYLLDKDTAMYPNPARHANLNLNPQGFAPGPPQFSDFSSYHVPGMINSDPHHCQSTQWNPGYAPPRDEWPPFGTGPVISNPGQISFTPPDFTSLQQQSQTGILPSGVIDTPVGQVSPQSQSRNPYRWISRTSPSNPGGKTRTKDKYRVVYTDHQRLELEKEFHYSRYITIRRKAELAASLNLSERQVKIWFQNRRAKERKINKKKMQQTQQASTTTPTPPSMGTTGNVAMVTSSNGVVSPSVPLTVKEEY
ncbi:homeobox protein CDX-1-like [Scleropages formosus]|uniref:Caudal type homeobox 1a n=1 Tax=Scleropages formosus TaxID=113540 RepID=A0A0N8K289_SCLFO|nr:homeobox protein CDX-1 [Scleropages formosus]KPP77065.1 homeobox protein CDX-1-like [Scleropages formosus]